MSIPFFAIWFERKDRSLRLARSAVDPRRADGNVIQLQYERDCRVHPHQDSEVRDALVPEDPLFPMTTRLRLVMMSPSVADCYLLL